MSTETNAHDLALAAVDEAFGEYVKNLFHNAAAPGSITNVGQALKVADATRTSLRKAITEGLK
jgi:hypothetical protein